MNLCGNAGKYSRTFFYHNAFFVWAYGKGNETEIDKDEIKGG